MLRRKSDCTAMEATASSSKVDQDDVRVFPYSVEHDPPAIRGHIEGSRGSGVVEAGQLARLVRRQVEQPEVLRRKRPLRVNESQAIWKEPVAFSFDPQPNCRHLDVRPVRPNRGHQWLRRQVEQRTAGYAGSRAIRRRMTCTSVVERRPAHERVALRPSDVDRETPPQHRGPALRSRGGSVAQRHRAID